MIFIDLLVENAQSNRPVEMNNICNHLRGNYVIPTFYFRIRVVCTEHLV